MVLLYLLILKKKNKCFYVWPIYQYIQPIYLYTKHIDSRFYILRLDIDLELTRSKEKFHYNINLIQLPTRLKQSSQGWTKLHESSRNSPDLFCSPNLGWQIVKGKFGRKFGLLLKVSRSKFLKRKSFSCVIRKSDSWRIWKYSDVSLLLDRLDVSDILHKTLKVVIHILTWCPLKSPF